jgi:hypothetical protein
MAGTGREADIATLAAIVHKNKALRPDLLQSVILEPEQVENLYRGMRPKMAIRGWQGADGDRAEIPHLHELHALLACEESQTFLSDFCRIGNVDGKERDIEPIADAPTVLHATAALVHERFQQGLSVSRKRALSAAMRPQIAIAEFFMALFGVGTFRAYLSSLDYDKACGYPLDIAGRVLHGGPGSIGAAQRIAQSDCHIEDAKTPDA